MTNELTGNEFKGMVGAHAAMFTPFDAKNCVNEEAIDQIIIDCGPCRAPYAPISHERERELLERFSNLSFN